MIKAPPHVKDMSQVLRLATALLQELLSEAQIPESHGAKHALRTLAHVERALAEAPALPPDRDLAVRLAALLHDADDHKYFPHDSRNAERIMRRAGASEPVLADAAHMIRLVSRTANGNDVPPEALERPELLWPRYADRIEAAGETGVARCRAYAEETDAPLVAAHTPRPRTAEEAWALATPQRLRAYQERGGGSESMLDHYFDALLPCSLAPPSGSAYLDAALRQGAEVLVRACLRLSRELPERQA